jgi:hypothetical protein
MNDQRCEICGWVERPDEMRRDESMNLVLVCPGCGRMICDGCWLHHLDVECGNPKKESACARK